MLIIQVESIACRDLFGVKAAAGLLFGTAQDCCVRRHLGIYVGPYSLLSGVVGQFVPSMFLQCPTWSTAFGARKHCGDDHLVLPYGRSVDHADVNKISQSVQLTT
jgi:hypothetical protein